MEHHRLGGIAVVQEPNQARYPSMPRHVLEYSEPDYERLSTEIGLLLTQLTQEQSSQAEMVGNGADEVAWRMAIETQVAAGVNLPEKTILALGEMTQFTCAAGGSDGNDRRPDMANAPRFSGSIHAAVGERFLAKARELNRQASRLQKIATGQESLSEENLRRQQPTEELEDSEIED